jgi:hypothetical protein
MLLQGRTTGTASTDIWRSDCCRGRRESRGRVRAAVQLQHLQHQHQLEVIRVGKRDRKRERVRETMPSRTLP